MVEVECVMCKDRLRRDIADIDAAWECFTIKKEQRYLCRDCVKMVAKAVLSEY